MCPQEAWLEASCSKKYLQPQAGKCDNCFASWNDFQVHSFKHSANADGALTMFLVVYEQVVKSAAGSENRQLT